MRVARSLIAAIKGHLRNRQLEDTKSIPKHQQPRE